MAMPEAAAWERDQLRRSIADLLVVEATSARTREAMASPSGVDPGLWASLVRTDLLALTVPEASGGQGASLIEAAVLFEELGARTAAVPVLSAALTSTLLANLPESAATRRLLGEVTAGRSIVVLHPVQARAPVVGGSLSMRGSDGGPVLTGSVVVAEAAGAEAFVVPVAHEGAADVTQAFLVQRSSATSVEPLSGMDPTRPLARVTLDGASGTSLADTPVVGAALRAALDHGALVVAAESAGVALRCVDLAVDYAKTRRAFGRPIGAFQAVKHRCATMFTAATAAEALVAEAARAIAQQRDDAALLLHLAKARACQAAVDVATSNVLAHGAIGFTWEHDASLLLRRAHGNLTLLGTPQSHRDAAADIITDRWNEENR